MKRFTESASGLSWVFNKHEPIPLSSLYLMTGACAQSETSLQTNLTELCQLDQNYF